MDRPPHLARAPLLLLAFGAASLSCAAGPAPPVRAPATAEADVDVRALLERHGPGAVAWLDAATLIVIGHHQESSYPCVFSPDGSSVMPLARTFTVDRVVRGTLARRDFDFSVPSDPSPTFPPRLTGTRRYLALLKPTPAAAARLQDPGHRFTMDTALQPADIVAVVDVDAGDAEIAAHAREVARWRDRLAFVFTPEAWHVLRAGVAPDLPAVARFQLALQRQELPRWRGREDVHARLGPPDRTEQREGRWIDGYDFQPLLRNGAPEGTLIGRFEITYGDTGEISIYREDFDVLRGGRPERATPEERKAQGMSWTTIERGWGRARR
jgi:hypothetical protein